MGKEKPENKQYCIFCMSKESGMSVYSVGLGRMGICLDCAKKAVKALVEHQAQAVPSDSGG